MAGPTFFGSTSTPTDNGSQAGPGPLTITPPGSMQAGDFVIIPVHQRLGNRSETYDFTNTGGQTWTFVMFRDHASVAANMAMWCCKFNGTWSANPAIEQGDGDTQPMTAPMLVIRPSSPSLTIDFDFSPRLTDYSAASPVTIPAITTRHNNALAIALWMSIDDNTWGSLTGTVGTWTDAITQIRNANGSQMSFSAAYQAFATAGTTGTVTKTQATNGPDAGIYCLFSLYERDATQDFAAVPDVDMYTDFETSTDGTAITVPIVTTATRATAAAAGSWTLGGAGGPNLTIASAAQKQLSPRSVKLSGTPYDDVSGTRGMQVNHQLTGGNAYILSWTKTSGGYAKLSAGFWLYTEVDYQQFETFSLLGLRESGGAMGCFLNINSTEAGFLRASLENAPSDPVLIAANILRNTWYWVTMQYDAAANVGSLRIYDSSFNQVGFSAVGRLAASGSTNANQLQLGDSHGEASTATLKRTFNDNVIMETTGIWPLGPGAPPSGGVKKSASQIGSGGMHDMTGGMQGAPTIVIPQQPRLRIPDYMRVPPNRRTPPELRI